MSAPPASVRVFVPTYHRAKLLRRALESVRRQTFSSWVCEVHNDAPDDPSPTQVVAGLNDPRITCVTHPRNLGGTATFNLFFRPTREPFYAVLEDDNAWAPDFLARLLAHAERNPDITIFWCNQRIAREIDDGEVEDTGTLVHADKGEPRRVEWGQHGQIFGALHAQSALLVRSRGTADFATPGVPIAVIESFRERLFPHPMLFIPEPLADFTVTRRTARSNDPQEWATLQTMLAATFLTHAGFDRETLKRLWRTCRAQRPPATNSLLLAALVEPACRPLRQYAAPLDWLRLAKSLLAHRHQLRVIRESRQRHADWWEYLERATSAQFAAAAGRKVA